jgi:hypothetical protein
MGKTIGGFDREEKERKRYACAKRMARAVQI